MRSLLIAFCVLLSWTASSGQVRDVYGKLDPKSTFEETKIAVDDFRAEEGYRLLHSDSVALVRIAEIIRTDLNFSPFYEIVEKDTFYMRHMELEIMTLLGWRHLGAEYVVTGVGTFGGDDVTISYKISFAETGSEFARGRFKSQASNYRRLAHQIANDIIYTLTGERGIFNTRLCFVSRRTGNKELFLCDYDGANIYQLTNNRSINISPAFAPDNQKILFTSYKDGPPLLYQYSISDGSIDPIGTYKGINTAARVSPDGKSVACVLSRDGNAEIYLLHRDGKIKRRLTYSMAIESSPTWSPTGNEIAFTSDRTGTPQIYVMNDEGTDIRRLTFVGNYNDSPDWSPKGDKIVFVSRVKGRFNICTVDITGDNFLVLTDKGDNENPRWSPDGNHITFSSNRDGEREIYLMDRFGHMEFRLTAGGGNSNPAWSGYGK
jgi:TolB protein